MMSSCSLSAICSADSPADGIWNDLTSDGIIGKMEESGSILCDLSQHRFKFVEPFKLQEQRFESSSTTNHICGRPLDGLTREK
ncbi:hypothetical protein TNCV_1399951 [Trichonephila clavipes]|nr:hypothetical protein TNCV_1399951 [Trichonephila clavipes]